MNLLYLEVEILDKEEGVILDQRGEEVNLDKEVKAIIDQEEMIKTQEREMILDREEAILNQKVGVLLKEAILAQKEAENQD